MYQSATRNKNAGLALAICQVHQFHPVRGLVLDGFDVPNFDRDRSVGVLIDPIV